MSVNIEDSQEVYDVIKELLPQIESQLKQQLEDKYAALWVEKDNSLKAKYEQEYKQRTREYRDQETRMEREFQKALQERTTMASKAAQESQESKDRETNEIKTKLIHLEKEVQFLRQQKENWTRLQRGYQRALRSLGVDQQNSNSTNIIDNQQLRGKDIPKNPPSDHKKHPSNSNFPHPVQTKKMNLTIETYNPKDLEGGNCAPKVKSSSFYETNRTEQSFSQMQGILSPPSVDPRLIESALSMAGNDKKVPTKTSFWNEDKKQELLKMIRIRMN